ncbi:tol-pal system protein YbgF [uncultured Salinisphaera sp.]|uniref:tol-pal system protein YbgF n=1 Tax=uncultured Salinisphaera sp. TaxID=359372 RepID=UPI0032B14136|tara:strand:- start:2457 stop:3179 length:723 start_codon:yes stop_codon:yes gene_type:complete
MADMRVSIRGLLIAAAVSAPLGAATAAPTMQLAQNNSGPNLFALYQQIQQLQQEVRDLNGQVDTLQYQLDQQKQGQRDLYQDIDKRLAKLESGATPAGSGADNGASGASAGNANVDPAVQSAYMAGFNKLKDGDYPAAIDAFKKFVQDNPETALTPNAWYWMGEAYYVQQKPDAARQSFETVVNRFAASPKVADSLYKIGLIQASSGENDNAKATFKRVVSQYPDSDAASQAKSRLSGAN